MIPSPVSYLCLVLMLVLSLQAISFSPLTRLVAKHERKIASNHHMIYSHLLMGLCLWTVTFTNSSSFPPLSLQKGWLEGAGEKTMSFPQGDKALAKYFPMENRPLLGNTLLAYHNDYSSPPSAKATEDFSCIFTMRNWWYS